MGTSADWQALSGCETSTLGTFAGGTGATGSASGGSTAGTTGASGSATAGAGTGTTMGEPVPNVMAAFSEIRIQADGNGQGFLVGELALLPTEVDLSRRSLVANGFSISAVHNHTLSLFPQLFFVHIAKHGNAIQMAQTLRQIMDQNRVGAGQISVPTSGTSGTGTSGASGGSSGSSSGGGTGL
jgi:hypothetical protein